MPSLEEVLGYENLTGLVKGTTTGVPQPLPESFYSTKRNVIGDSGRYTRVTGERRTSKLSKYGSPARRRELRDVAEVDVKLLHSFEEQPIDPLTMQKLRNYDNYDVQRMGMQEVSRQANEFRQLFANTRTVATLQVLANGVLYWDSEGNLLPNSSGAQETHSFQMNANNQNQLNGIITASWATATTDIPLQLRTLKQRAAQQTGYPLRLALYGENVPSYFAVNDYVKEFLARNPTMQAKYLESADIPAGLFGFQWIPVYESFFEDSAGTNQTIFGGDTVVFTPEVSSDWWEVLEGSYLVPSTIDMLPNMEALIDSYQTVYGAFGYAVGGHNPPTAISYYGDTHIPTLKVPDAVYQADVTPAGT